MYYIPIKYIIDYPYVILLFVLIIFLLFFIKKKLYSEEKEIESETNHTFEELDQRQISTRRQLADKIHQYQSGKLSWQELMDSLHDASKQYPEDESIFDLYALIEHEPKRGGFGGVSEVGWQSYQRKITNILSEFESQLK